MRLFLAFILLCAASPALALTCQNDYAGAAGCAANSSAAGDCETLGFSKTSEAGCKHFLYCPFDTSYKRCVSSESSVDCATLGFTKTDKSSWCSSLVSCPADSSYSVCSNGIDCEKLGFTTQDKSAWCNHIVTCPTNSSLTACGYDDKCLAYPLNLGPADDTWFENLPYGAKYETCDAASGDKYAQITGCETYYAYNAGSSDVTKKCRSKCKIGDYYYTIDRYSALGNPGFCSTTKLTSSSSLYAASSLIGVVINITNNGYSGTIMGLKSIGTYSNGSCATTSLTDGVTNTKTLAASTSTSNVCVQAALAAQKYSLSTIPAGEWYLPAANEWISSSQDKDLFSSKYLPNGKIYMTSTGAWKLEAGGSEAGLYQGSTSTTMDAVPFTKFDH